MTGSGYADRRKGEPHPTFAIDAGGHSLLPFAQRLFAVSYSCAQVTEALMPA